MVFPATMWENLMGTGGIATLKKGGEKQPLSSTTEKQKNGFFSTLKSSFSAPAPKNRLLPLVKKEKTPFLQGEDHQLVSSWDSGENELVGLQEFPEESKARAEASKTRVEVLPQELLVMLMEITGSEQPVAQTPPAYLGETTGGEKGGITLLAGDGVLIIENLANAAGNIEEAATNALERGKLSFRSGKAEGNTTSLVEEILPGAEKAASNLTPSAIGQKLVIRKESCGEKAKLEPATPAGGNSGWEGLELVNSEGIGKKPLLPCTCSQIGQGACGEAMTEETVKEAGGDLLGKAAQELKQELKRELAAKVENGEVVYREQEKGVKRISSEHLLKSAPVATQEPFPLQEALRNAADSSSLARTATPPEGKGQALKNGEGDSFLQHEVLKQIVQGAKLISQPTRAELHLQLKPESLGHLHLKLAVENGVITAHFAAESQQVCRLIESNMDQLKQALHEQGLRFGSLQVSVGGGTVSGGFKQAEQQSFAFSAFNGGMHGYNGNSAAEGEMAPYELHLKTESYYSSGEGKINCWA